MTIGLVCLSAALVAVSIALPLLLSMGHKARQQSVKLECPTWNKAQLEAFHARVTPTQGSLRDACERRSGQRHTRQSAIER